MRIWKYSGMYMVATGIIHNVVGLLMELSRIIHSSNSHSFLIVVDIPKSYFVSGTSLVNSSN